MDERILLAGNREVWRVGDAVERATKPWSKSVMRFLRHLERDGLPVEHIISVDENLEISRFVEGEIVHPKKWSDDALFEIGRLVADLHNSSRNFVPCSDDIWQRWGLRKIGIGERIVCHGDIAPWNIITEGVKPKTLLDWEYAGLLDPFVELARVCWLFPQLVDDDLQVLHNLPSAKKRAEQVRIIADGYGLSAAKRSKLIEQIIEVVICETAHEAIAPDHQSDPLTFGSEGNLWGFAWRTRSLYWIWRNKEILNDALK
ncbi:MAG: phosphotransferase [Defluviitaleaceae bacterium]|nr:phosphotransferase [Defluviitaleaceae bacterium]